MAYSFLYLYFNVQFSVRQVFLSFPKYFILSRKFHLPMFWHDTFSTTNRNPARSLLKSLHLKKPRTPFYKVSGLLLSSGRGLEPLSQNKNPVKKGGLAHRHASVCNLYAKLILDIVKNLIIFRFSTHLHKIIRYAIL